MHLPDGEWTEPLRWARDRNRGLLFTADAAGQLFSFDENRVSFARKAHLAPVGPMAATPDGRLFGFCGTEMANLFCCDTVSGSVINLGSQLPFWRSVAMATSSATRSPAATVKSYSARTTTEGISGCTFRSSSLAK